MADPGEGPGWPGPPLFLDQNEARRAEKNFFETAPSPPHLRAWMTANPPPPPSPYLKVWIRHSLMYKRAKFVCSHGHIFQGIMVIFRVKMLILTMLSVLYYFFDILMF